MKDERSTPDTPTDSDPTVDSFDEVDSFDVELEKRVHEFIADARPTDGPAPAG
ncbi:hypothetical protein ACFJGV_13790 [Cnuibacter sp. UC19_7]|uniref:hypothetical protein n=1 Tax=Cnuibacter sp. UC19_7 TaxID=3350166 RepID=UPI003671AD61